MAVTTVPAPHRRTFDMTTWSRLQLLGWAALLSAGLWAIVLFTLTR